jgi:hypothetical protein
VPGVREPRSLAPNRGRASVTASDHMKVNEGSILPAVLH